MSFVIPVIVFTLAYNIPKFFELTTTTKTVSGDILGNKFDECITNLFNNGTNLNTYVSRDKTSIFEHANHSSTNDFTFNISTLKEDIFFVAQQSTKMILESCCNCTKKKFLDSSDNADCNASKISGFILNLVEYLGDPEGRHDLQTFKTVLNVRWNMQMTLILEFLSLDNSIFHSVKDSIIIEEICHKFHIRYGLIHITGH